MATYTFEFCRTIILRGEVIVEARSEDEAYEIAEEEAALLDEASASDIEELDLEVELIEAIDDDDDLGD